MLVLSRKEQEVIKLGHDITIHVVRIQAGKVKIGIEAPPGVLIIREEIEDRNDGQKESNNSPERH